MFNNYNKANSKKAYLLSVILHGAIIVIYILTIMVSYKEKNIMNINISSNSSGSSAYINVTYQPEIQKQFNSQNNINFSPESFNSKVKFNYTKKQDKYKRKYKVQKANKITQQNKGTGGNSHDDTTAKTIIKDQSFLNYKAPNYPRRALHLKQQGNVTLRMLLMPNGTITKVMIHKSSGYKMLDNSVLETIKYWNNKRKVNKPTWIEIDIDFIIK